MGEGPKDRAQLQATGRVAAKKGDACGAICAAASLHLAASAINFDTYECMIFASPLRDEIASRPVASRESLVGGNLPLPDGVEIDEKALARFRVA